MISYKQRLLLKYEGKVVCDEEKMTSKNTKPLAQLSHYCKEHQIKLTPLRADVFNLICKSKQPITAYELLRQLRLTRDNAEPPTVYRVLDFLLKANFIHRIETSNAYMACIHPDETHHSQILLCTSCGDAVEIDSAALMPVLQRSAKKHEFLIANELIEIRGKCINCH
jgi:Fur family zinc uptake transcriptional regulator